LFKKGDRLYLVPVPDHNFADLDNLKNLAENICPELEDCQIFGDVKLALDHITEIVNQDDLIVLCGSLYLLGSFLKMTSNQL
ncbi:MAG TPA: bifunctional folylpolyglutamate synthase/dihydrofolate synthase, partial [Allocoleopsis sp.]